MKRELILQIAEIETKNDVKKVLNNIVNSFHNQQITKEQFNHLMYDFNFTLQHLGILKSN